jgi:hypothetical protein
MATTDPSVPPDRIARRRTELEQARGFQAGPETRDIVRNAARTAHVVGGVLQGVSATSPLKSVGTWLSILGRRLVGLVEAAIPGTLRHMFVRHLIGVVYLFGLFVVVVGTVFDFARPYRSAAWKLLAALLALDLLLLLVSAAIRSWRGVMRIVGRAVLFLVVVAVVVVLALGVRAAPGFVRDVADRVGGRKETVVVWTKSGTGFAGVLRSTEGAALVVLCTTAPDRQPGRKLSFPRESISHIEDLGSEHRSKPRRC